MRNDAIATILNNNNNNNFRSYSVSQTMLLTFLLSLLLFGYGASATDGVKLRENFINAIKFETEAVKKAMSELNNVLQGETDACLKMSEGYYGQKTNPFDMVQELHGCTPYDKRLSYACLLQTASVTAIKNRFSLSNAEVKQLMQQLPSMLKTNPSLGPQSKATECPYPEKIPCQSRAHYRRHDGRCNNLLYPLWGSTHQPQTRFLPPDYSDGISEPRRARSGSELPNARLISTTVHTDMDISDPVRTHMHTVVGQFLTHDIMRTARSRMAVNNLNSVNAKVTELQDVRCGDDGCQTDGPENRECYPIMEPHDDTSSGGGRRCLMFVRSLGAPPANCAMGPRQQINELTSFVDLSQVYGNDENVSMELRELTPIDRGRMRVSSHPAGNFKPLLPRLPTVNPRFCRGADPSRNLTCFQTGDFRANQWPGLTSQHTIWVREHNRVAEKLHELNPHWCGERLYQESRRICIALCERIIYEEYLPSLFSPTAMREFGLQLVKTGYWNGYDRRVKPDLATSFTTTAFRFGHSQKQTKMNGRNANFDVISDPFLTEVFFRPMMLYNEPARGMDMVTLGLLGDSAHAQDVHITGELTEHLFTNDPPHGRGPDLAAIDITRGREHGVPGYNAFREWCGLEKAETFDDFVEIPPDIRGKLRQLYEHPDDVDFWTAGLAEQPVDGSVFGSTFSCIVGRQFYNLKAGNRYWFENKLHNPYPFTEAQLAEIRKVSYAKILCENSDFLPKIQPKVMFLPYSEIAAIAKVRPTILDGKEDIYGHSGNERVSCHELPDLDLRAWKEYQYSDAILCGPSRSAPLKSRY